MRKSRVPYAPLADPQKKIRDGGPRDPRHPFRRAQGASVHEGRHHPHALAHREHVHRRCLSAAGCLRWVCATPRRLTPAGCCQPRPRVPAAGEALLNLRSVYPIPSRRPSKIP
jgi:hypothetical protein